MTRKFVMIQFNLVIATLGFAKILMRRSLNFAMVAIACAVLLLLATKDVRADNQLANENLPTAWKSDAELTDVFFLNNELGWAVGAQGVILRTTNGGIDWIEVSQAVPLATGPQLGLSEKIAAMRAGQKTRWTGVADGSDDRLNSHRCRFQSIHFVDAQHGWVAGGYDVPYIGRSRGVILKTEDGGVSWQSINGLFLSKINKVYFSDRANGWAVGDRGNLHQTGISFTSNGGQTWSSQSSGEMRDWVDAVQTSGGFIGVAESGELATVNNNQLQPSILLNGAQAKLNRICLLDPQQGIGVGRDGTVIKTNDAGRSFTPIIKSDQTTDGAAAANGLIQQLQLFDFTAVCVSPGKIWFAGNPGSIVFSVDRSSGAVMTHTTGVAVPIFDLHFSDDQHGWAVGALGQILATNDGGQSWQVQRGQYRSVALLGVADSAQQLPLEAFVQYAGEDHRICAAAVLDADENVGAVRQAVERLGCSICLTNSREQLVRTIRTLRPNVIVGNSDGLARARFLREAVVAAANPEAYPQQISLAHLEPWTVEKIAFRDAVGTMTIDSRRLLPGVGALIEDQTALSRATLGLPLANVESVNYRVEHGLNGNRLEDRDLFGRMVGMSQTVPTRRTENRFRGNLTSIQLVNSKQEKLEAFAAFRLHSESDLRIWSQQIQAWSLNLDANVVGVWLAQLAERYLQVGETQLAAHTFELLATQNGEHTLAPAAISWLVQYYASDEFSQIAYQKYQTQRRMEQASQNNRRWSGGRTKQPVTEMIQTNDDGVSQLVWTPVADSLPTTGMMLQSDDGLALAAMNDDISDELELNAIDSPASLTESEALEIIPTDDALPFFQDRWRIAGQYLLQLGQLDPDLVKGREYQQLESIVNRKLNGAKYAEPILKRIAFEKVAGGEDLMLAAQTELRLAELTTTGTALPMLHCERASARPRLDGVLNDSAWSAFRERKTTESSNGDQTWWAYDDQHLYLAIVCQKIPGQYYQSTTDPRPRDADLSRRDRVSISIDVDRDYRSAMKLEVDCRGWCREQCGGAIGWNPKWFIAQAEDEQQWTVEIAIPLSELISPSAEAAANSEIQSRIWAVGIARRLANDSVVWSQPENTSAISALTGHWQAELSPRPATFSLLQFR